MRLIVLFMTICLLSNTSKNTVSAYEDSKRYDFLLKGMDDQRQRLRTGIYRASGRFISDTSALGRLDGPVKIFSAFDFDADKLRFDRSEPFRAGKISNPGGKTQSSWETKFRGGRLIQLKDRYISNSDGSFLVQIGSLSDGVEDNVKPLDIRVFGLFYWSDLTSFPATTYSNCLQYLEKQKPDEVVEERRGFWRITWTFPEVSTMTLRRTLWVDQKSGFSPIRMELRYRSNRMPVGQWPAPMFESETTWTEIAGVWVPKTTHVVDKNSPPAIQSYELSLDWENVNGMVPPETFTLEGLKLTPGYQVVDDTLGRTIVVGSIGDNHGLVEQAAPVPPPSAPNRSWRSWSSFLPYFLGGFGVFVIALAAWFRFRPVRRGTSMV